MISYVHDVIFNVICVCCHIWCRVNMISFAWCMCIWYHMFGVYLIWYLHWFRLFLMLSRPPLPGWFKCSPWPVQMQDLACSNAGPARPLRLSVGPGTKIRLPWFITPYQTSHRMHSHPNPLSLMLIDLFAMLLLARSMLAWLRRKFIPVFQGKDHFDKILVSTFNISHRSWQNYQIFSTIVFSQLQWSRSLITLWHALDVKNNWTAALFSTKPC